MLRGFGRGNWREECEWYGEGLFEHGGGICKDEICKSTVGISFQPMFTQTTRSFHPVDLNS